MCDVGLLEAALFRPQTGYHADLIAEASALWESLAQTPPFVDGNERTAFAATYGFVIGLYETASFRLDQLEAWLRDNTAPMLGGT